jgi:hypothetical protein
MGLEIYDHFNSIVVVDRENGGRKKKKVKIDTLGLWGSCTL